MNALSLVRVRTRNLWHHLTPAPTLWLPRNQAERPILSKVTLMQRDAASVPYGGMTSTPCRCKSKECICGPIEEVPTKNADNAFLGTFGKATVGTAPPVPLRLLYRGRIKPIDATSANEEKVLAFKCQCGKGLLRRKASRKPCKACGGTVERAERRYAELGNKNRVTCEALFCHGDKETDGFSRTIAVRYLSKRMVYAPRGNAKGQENAPKVVRDRKVSSARHSQPWFAASDVEDLVSEAYLWFAGANVTGKGRKLALTGNRLHDTCNACRRAMTYYTRAKQTERKALDVMEYAAVLRENGERSKRSLVYDERLVELIKQEGTANQFTLAKALHVNQATVSRLFAKLRQTIFTA